MRFCDSIVLLSSLIVATIVPVDSANIIVGDDPTKFNFQWQDGGCYIPIKNVRVGDTIEFQFRNHDVYKLKSKEAFESCDFTESELLAPFGESPYKYTVTKEDAMPPPLADGDSTGPSFRSLYFTCSVGAHCLGKQRIRVDVDIDYNSSTSTFRSSGVPGLPPRTEDPVSKFVLGADDGSCARVQNGEPESILDRFMESSCDEPVEEIDEYGRVNWFRSCLSPPLTLTPGGVVNQATIMNYPFPTDHRVILGRRTWEFVQGDLNNLTPVPIKQLYIHHILGGIVMGNGAESINRVDEDAPFPPPYARLSGDFDDVMTFHLIDLRGTGDNWLECLECRCKDVDGSYLGIGGSGGDGRADDTGGVACCHNCTALTTPKIDYRMRYNVSWSEVGDGEAVIPIVSMTGDVARAIGNSVEWDVPQYEDLPDSQRLPENPMIQVLVHEGPLKEIFGSVAFDYSDYDFETYKIHRCIGHMHIGAVEAWIMNAETNEVICNFKVTYGDDPSKDENFLTAISVQNFDTPITLSGDTKLKMVTHYDATVLHTGVMGLLTLFVSNDDPIELHQDEVKLTVDLCETPKCNASMLPSTEGIETCKDNLDNLCNLFDICSCEALLSLPMVEDGCDGKLATTRGNYDVTQFCAKHCGCKQSEEEVNNIIMEEVNRRFSASYKEACTFATENCKSYLSNIYTCGEETKNGVGETVIHSAVHDVLKFDEGSRYTLKMAKLGNEALQRFQTVDVNENIQKCSLEELILMDIEPLPESEKMPTSSANYSTFSSFTSNVFAAAAFVLLLNLY